MPEVFKKISINIILICTFLVLLTPLVFGQSFYYHFSGFKALYFMGLVEVILLVYFILCIYYPIYRPSLNRVSVAVITFLAVLTVSSVFGRDLPNSFWSTYERMDGLLFWFHLLAFFLIISSVIKKTDLWDKLFSFSIGVASVVSIIALLEKVKIVDIKFFLNGSTLGSTTFLGTYLLFNVFISFYLFLLPDIKKNLKIFYFFNLVIIMLGLIFNVRGKASFAAFTLGILLVFIFWIVSKSNRVLKIIGAFIAFLFLSLGIVVIFINFIPNSQVSQEILNFTKTGTLDGRTIVWDIAREGFKEKPILGWGLANFSIPFIEYYNPCLGTDKCGHGFWYDNPHNIIWKNLTETGVVGFVSYFAIFFFTIYSLWLLYKRDENNKNNKNNFWLAVIFTSLLCSYFIQNLTSVDSVSSLIMFFFVIGFIANTISPQQKIEAETKKTTHNIFAVGAILLFSVSFVYFVIKPLQSSFYATKALASPISYENQLFYIKKALNSSDLGRNEMLESFSKNFYNASLGIKVGDIVDKSFFDELNFLINKLSNIPKNSAFYYKNHFVLGELYNVYAKFDPTKSRDAEKVFQELINISPQNQNGYAGLLQSYLYQGRNSEAFPLVEKIVAMEPNLLNSRMMEINIIHWILKDEKLLKEKIKEITTANPSWVNRFSGYLK
ncbi:MAG: O-antigen ligase family protein [Parcubacteria group bacterium]|nr:O-antigen ligase family protein [Parcubacteria group bacterium]